MTDKLLLVRFAAHNRPGQMEEVNMDKRMLGHFQDVASGHHFKSQSITADGNLNATTYSVRPRKLLMMASLFPNSDRTS